MGARDSSKWEAAFGALAFWRARGPGAPHLSFSLRRGLGPTRSIHEERVPVAGIPWFGTFEAVVLLHNLYQVYRRGLLRN